MLADGEEDARQAASPSLGPFQSNMSSDFSSMADFGLAARVDPPQVSFTANADLPMRNPGPVPGDQPDFSFADEITFSAFREVGGLNELWQQTSFVGMLLVGSPIADDHVQEHSLLVRRA